MGWGGVSGWGVVGWGEWWVGWGGEGWGEQSGGVGWGGVHHDEGSLFLHLGREVRTIPGVGRSCPLL